MKQATEQRLRVAMVLERFDPKLGGLESWTEGMARFLLDRGHHVSVVACDGRGSSEGIVLECVGHNPSFVGRAQLIAERLAQRHFDIVHDTGAGFSADVFQPQTGSRLVNADLDIAALPWRRWLRAKLAPSARRWRRDLAALERCQFIDPERIIAVSDMVRRQIAERFGLDGARITVIHNGIDTARFDPARLAERREVARQRWGFTAATVFLLVANNFRLKGVAVAVRALARLANALPHARLAVAGSGDATAYRQLAHRLGVADRVAFLGHLPDITDAYAAADIAIQPTHYDACSLSTLEGLASGLPTITTATNGAGELITEGREGMVLPRSTDHASLAAAMARLAGLTDRACMGADARHLAVAHDVARNHARVEEFYWHRLAVKR